MAKYDGYLKFNSKENALDALKTRCWYLSQGFSDSELMTVAESCGAIVKHKEGYVVKPGAYVRALQELVGEKGLDLKRINDERLERLDGENGKV